MSVSSLLADLGYDIGRLDGEMNNIELTIERFDPLANPRGMAISYTCGQYTDVHAASL
jgi:hypothetical protein